MYLELGKNIFINLNIKYENKIEASNLEDGDISFLWNFLAVMLILY